MIRNPCVYKNFLCVLFYRTMCDKLVFMTDKSSSIVSEWGLGMNFLLCTGTRTIHAFNSNNGKELGTF